MLGQDLLEGLDGDALEETRLGVGVAGGEGLGRGAVVGFDDQQAAQHAGAVVAQERPGQQRSEEHTSELQSLMRISYAVFCLKKKKKIAYDISTYCLSSTQTRHENK